MRRSLSWPSFPWTSIYRRERGPIIIEGKEGQLSKGKRANVTARNAAADVLTLERKLSDLVNAAYGLTADEVVLMWRTAPPRMPLDPAEELRRVGAKPVNRMIMEPFEDR